MPQGLGDEVSPALRDELLALRRESERLDRIIAEKSPARPRPWHKQARPNQIPPPGDWNICLFLAGRGFGKTKLAAEWLAEQAATHPHTEWAVVAPTWRDCRKVCIEGTSGLLKAFLPGELHSVNASDLTVRLNNGSKIYGYSADGYERLRGSNLAGAWVDEAAVMTSVSDLFSEALIPALRIGVNPRVVITTTPRPIPFLRDLVARTDGSCAVVRGSTWDNAANLSKTALAELRARYEGTRVGRQELEGELLADIDGALWNREWIEATRVKKLPSMARIVVALDPAVTSGEKADDTGIIVAGRDIDGHFYIIEDLTMKGTPHACMRVAAKAYHKWHADRLIAEVNNGGDYLKAVLSTVDDSVAYGTVRATRGKVTRAEPIAALWEQGRGHIFGGMPTLEDQMCCYTADTQDSPDNLDACFVAGTSVLTARGDIPIELVRPGELVWTRAGWKPVLRSELTRRGAKVMAVELSNGQRLTGTPNHRIWTQNGWTRLDSLVWGDTLSGWTITPSPSNSMASPTGATLMENSGRIASTTRLREVAAETISIEMSGVPPIQEWQFREGGTSTTKTTTHSTTTRPTSRSSRRLNIVVITRIMKRLGNVFERMLNGSALSLPSGMAAKPVLRGIVSTDDARGTTGSTQLGVVTAAAVSIARQPASLLGTAHGPASTASTTSLIAISVESPARFVEPSSGSPSTDQSPKPAAVSVLWSYAASEGADVYDLMVADQHEFVAGGVIVHNCVWAATELQIGASAMIYLSAISRICTKCDMPSSRTAPSCRSCGAEFPSLISA